MKNQMTMRIGLANPSGGMPIECERRDLPVMVSANSFFDHETGEFRTVPQDLMDLDVALDSAGFVAMARYRRYPWTVAQYVNLALMNGFTWWSQMDCCCEPEIASDRDTVIGRVHATAQMLQLCRVQFLRIMEAAPEFVLFSTEPMPIVQGWRPDDYKLSAALTDAALGGQWPEMVGVGSVCRRNLSGPDGLWRVLHALDAVLPRHVRLHLFGIKGAAIRGLAQHPRVISVDSMAFEFRARVTAREAGIPKTIAHRAATLDRWLARQAELARDESGQLPLGT